MGNGKRHITRSSGSVSTKGLSLEGGHIKRAVGKKNIEKQTIQEFEKNIRDQSKFSTKTTNSNQNKPVQVIKKNSLDKSKIINNVVKHKVKENMSQVISELTNVLKSPNTQVDKNFSKLKEKVEEDYVLVKENEDKVKDVDFFLDTEAEKEPKDEKNYIVYDSLTALEEKEKPYDYGIIKRKSFPMSYIKRKSLKIINNANDPDILYRNHPDTRVLYVSESHPLYTKVVSKIGMTLNYLYIKEGSLLSTLFFNILNKLYGNLEGNFLLTEPCFGVQTKEYKAQTVLLDVVLDYKNTAYYVLAEVIKSNLLDLVNVDSVQLKNVILVNVDIIFSF